ncbi:hypothetical protein BP5796_06663 [Coleophoma crateriformis]|uniref:Rrn9 domain-containing protein n=1 Tax=Coleophoma crateriformis TaxID=565419 RepID=A0A3D8RP21_9HELO|nr:hypothetical protein BP5796_06663 [Coleophoma crateriformis]
MSDSEHSQETEDEDPARPNRYNGPPSTWQSLTSQERGLASTLTQLRNQDLSIHLYNAHALKARAREFETTLKSKPERSTFLEGSQLESERAYTVPQSWTAWPLPADIVPRENESVGPVSKDEQFTLRRRDIPFPSRGLEDILLGVALKFAKETFNQREWNEEDDDLMHDENVHHGKGEGRRATSLNNPPKSGNKLGGNQIHSVPRFSGLGDSAELDGDHVAVDRPFKQSSEAAPDKVLMRPVVSADDERSGEILRPSIRHTLSKLDEALMALHHARKICHEYSSNPTGSKRGRSGGSPSGSETDAAEIPARRPRGRPRNQSLPGRENMDLATHENPGQWRAKPTSIGRPRKQYEKMPGETEQDYLIRVARLQKKPLPSFAPVRETKAPELSREPPRKTPRKKLDPERARSRRNRHLRPRDWSEVLGSAALVGFSPEVIAKATQRCANLFGESMTMRTLIQAPVLSTNSSIVDNYMPQEIPDLGLAAETVELSSESSETDSNTDGSASESSMQDSGRTPAFPKPRGIVPRTQSCFCPIEECPRSNRGFAKERSLKRHMKGSHKMNPQQISDILFGGRDEMSGAVHTDGFLKPVLDKKSTRGKDKGHRKEGRWIRGTKADEVKGGNETSESSESESLKSEDVDDDSSASL